MVHVTQNVSSKHQTSFAVSPSFKSERMEGDDDLEEWFDFSQSGDWERMIASIEQIFRDGGIW